MQSVNDGREFLREAAPMRFLLLVCLLCSFTGPAAARKRPPVVMLSIDGLRPDMVLQPDRFHLKIPNLRRLVREGASARSVRTVLPSLTYPGHATLVTGVSPAVHGITNNLPFDPLEQNQRGWFWYAEDIRRPTLWQVARKNGLRVGAVDWPVTVGAAIDYLIPQFWRASRPDDRKLLRSLSTPGLLAEVEKAVGPYPAGADYNMDGDYQRAGAALHILRTRKPDLMLAYLGALDHEEHGTGPFSDYTRGALEEIDMLVGRIWRAAGPDAVLLVVSDHGFSELKKGVFLHGRLAQEGFFNSQTWQVRLWSGLGCGAVMLAPDCPPARAARVREILEEVVQAGIGEVLEPAQVAALGGFPGAAWVVALKPGYAFWADTAPGPLLRDVPDHGVHGYAPDQEEMNASLIVHGPGVPKRDLGAVDMRDIAPTVAALLGFQMPTAEGRDLLAR